MAIDLAEELGKLQKKKHGQFYWLVFNLKVAMKEGVLRHKPLFTILGVVVLISGFILRSLIQPGFIWLRMHTFDILLLATLVVGLRIIKRKLAEKGKRLRLLWRFTALVGVIFLMRIEAYNYMALYCRYRALHEADLEQLPLTAHERIQPIVSLRQLADGVMDQGKHPSEPDFVRIGENFRFTMAVEPDSEVTRLLGTIDEIIDLPGNSASPDFSKENRHQVGFAVGEHMLLGKNSHAATTKTFGPFRFFSYRADDVRYLENDNGEMVEVVSLSRLGGSWWSRWIFPWPEFGGVQVIHQSRGGWGHALHHVLFGDGEWIRPENVAKYPFLKGQNLLPYDVSRYLAKSFRYERGFMAPFPLYHRGDTIIPELPDDKNEMPYTIYAEFGQKGDERNKLYHYFALEPWQYWQHGLTDSLFIPADGIGPTMVYRHYLRGEGLIGVGAIASQVLGSDIHVDWGHAKPVEHRPWIHIVGGMPRLFWLTTIVVFDDKHREASRYSASSMPNIVLTDARSGRSLWVKANYPEGWEGEVTASLSDILGNVPVVKKQ